MLAHHARSVNDQGQIYLMPDCMTGLAWYSNFKQRFWTCLISRVISYVVASVLMCAMLQVAYRCSDSSTPSPPTYNVFGGTLNLAQSTQI